MIPKVIHYCWFGSQPLSELAVKCIESWKKFCPGYEIKEWSERNFDINCCDYVKEAYEAQKWAFVSDYARFKILWENGGLYFDTDVEMIKPLDDIIDRGAFFGCEPILLKMKNGKKMDGLAVAPGLGLATAARTDFYKMILEYYHKIHFKTEDARCDLTTVVERVTTIFKQIGWNETNIRGVQKCSDIFIYPAEYFCPFSPIDGDLRLTNNSRTIHHYAGSWQSRTEKKLNQLQRKMLKAGKAGFIMERIFLFPLRAINKIQKKGMTNTVIFTIKKFVKIINKTDGSGGYSLRFKSFEQNKILWGII